MIKRIALVCSLAFCACQNQTETHTPDPLEEVKKSFEVRSSSYDSVSIVDADSLYTFYFLPKDTIEDMGGQLYGAFSLHKYDILKGDLNGDGLEDAVFKYTFSPYKQSNQLTYFKILLRKEDTLQEVGEIFGGANCEGPQLSAKEIRSGNVVFHALDYASGDPCSSPSLKSTMTFKIENQKIVKL